MRINFPCHKQPAGSVYCGYYMCEHMRQLGRYTKDLERDQRETHEGPLHEQQLLHVVDNLCHFILHEVVHIDGDFIHPEHELSADRKYESLHQWDNQQLRVGYSSVTQGK